MPLITRSSSSSSPSDGVGDSPEEATTRTLRTRSSDVSNAFLLDESPVQRDDLNSNDDMKESTKSTPRRSNKSSRKTMSSSEEAAEMMLVSNKRRKISDDASSHRGDDFSSTNNISHPGPNDVICGRGGESNAHFGNKKYRYIIESLKSKYSHASRGEKTAIATDIVALWRKMDPPGRFLKQNDQEQDTIGQIGHHDSTTRGAWYDVGDDHARKKTSQTLRDTENPSAAEYISLFGKKDAELLQVCIEYLQEKTPGSGEVVDPFGLLSQKRSTKKMKQQLSSPLDLQQFRLASTDTSSYPMQSARGARKSSPSSIAHRVPSELDVQPHHLLMSMPSNNHNLDRRGVLYSRKDEDGNDDNDVKILHIYRSEKVSRRGKHPVVLAPYASKKKSERVSKRKKVTISVPKEEEDMSSLLAVPVSKKHSRQNWSEAEDCQLRQLVEGFTSLNQRIRWVQISSEMPGRNGKQCRERWMYQLQPGLKKEDFSPEEDALLDRLVEKMGKKWSKISNEMPGRTDMDAKNRYNVRERERSRTKRQQERKGKGEVFSNDTLSIHQTDNAADGGQKISAGTEALISLCDVALAKEQEESVERSMEGGDTSTEGTASSESPEVGMRVRVRFEGDNGDYTFYGGTITKVNSVSSELQDLAAAMDIDGLANAVANGAHSPSTDQSYQTNVYSIGLVDASVAPPSKITIKYDDESVEECVYPDPDIQLVASNLSEEEMSLSNELLNLNVSLSLREVHTEKRKQSDSQIFPLDPDVKGSGLHSDCVPLETVRGLLLGNLDPIELAMRLLPSDEVVLVRKKWKKSD